MKANELRIGNFVETNGILWKGGTHDFGLMYMPEFEPIPLTEEWLEKFGFVKESKYFCFVKISNELSICFNYAKPPSGDFGQIGLEKWFEGLGQNVYIEFPNKIKYVHQLQNLYFALTGEELIII